MEIKPTSSRPPYIEWAEAFAYRLLELEEGEADLHHLIDVGYELFPDRGHEDPRLVAEEEFRREA